MAKRKFESDIEVQGKVITINGLASEFLKANGDKDNSKYVKNAYNNKFIYTSGAQTFTLPADTQVLNVFLNKAPLYITSEYTVAGTTLTIVAGVVLAANDEIYVTGMN